MTTCSFCAEVIEDRARRCPHCGERLVGHDDLVAGLEDVAPDAAFAAQVREWPDDSLLRALRDHPDEYEAARQRTLLDEVRGRGLPIPERLAASSLLARLKALAGWILLGWLLLGLARAALA